MVHPPKTVSAWDTGVPADTLKFVGAKSCTVPDGFVRNLLFILTFLFSSYKRQTFSFIFSVFYRKNVSYFDGYLW